LSRPTDTTQLQAVEKSYRACSGETGFTGCTLPAQSHREPSCETGSGQRWAPCWERCSASELAFGRAGTTVLPWASLPAAHSPSLPACSPILGENHHGSLLHGERSSTALRSGMAAPLKPDRQITRVFMRRGETCPATIPCAGARALGQPPA